ncbi:MAG: glyoxalase [Chloroflexi bacterium]|nr:glyoxalase [Chloroflexota bacterium]
MIVNSVHLIFFVEDQARSTSFYADLFGRSPRLNVPGMSEFELIDGTVLGLMPVTGIMRLLGEALPNPEQASGIPRAELYLVVDDAVSVLKTALAAGAQLVSDVQPRDWGQSVGYCLDLDGHLLAFAEPINEALSVD